VCRYCIALHGMKGAELIEGNVAFAYAARTAALNHIDQAHHD
jgi:hypothetical protein